MMEITLLRHVKTAIPDGLCYGRTNAELPAGYRENHMQIVRGLAGSKFHAIYSSPLSRCLLLAGEFVKPGVNLVIDDRLMELHFGQWELKPWVKIWETAGKEGFFSDFINTPAPGGESFQQLANRVASFLQEVTTTQAGKSILVVTHGGPIRAIRSFLENTPLHEAFNQKVDFGQWFTYKLPVK